MKHIRLLCFALLLMPCNQDSDSGFSSDAANGDTGKSGSLARFAIFDDYLYVVDNSDLNVSSILEPENPVQINTVPIGFNIETIFNYKNYIYKSLQNGMFIYGIDNPEEPNYLSDVQHFTACDPVVANDTHAFVTVHSNIGCVTTINVLEIYDVNNVLQPALISSRNLT